MAGNGTADDPNADSLKAVQTRLRALVRCVGDCGCGDDTSEQVLLDIDLDGGRYVLIRMPGAQRKTVALSPREIEIVRLVAGGHPNKVIAAVLDISCWTVCTHLRRIFSKFGVSSRAAMVARSAEFVGSVESLALPHVGSPEYRSRNHGLWREQAEHPALRESGLVLDSQEGR